MIERRKILMGAGAAFTTSLFTGRVKGANDRIAVGHIGIGAMGSSNLGFALRLTDTVEPVDRVLRTPHIPAVRSVGAPG